MFNVNGVPGYKELLKIKKSNTEQNKKFNFFIFGFLIISIILMFYIGVTPFVFFIVFTCFAKLISSVNIYPKYEDYYYNTFLPNVCSYMGVYDLSYIDNQECRYVVNQSGLNCLTDGSIDIETCFIKKDNEFNHFGFYRKSESDDDGTTITFDGLFFVKELNDPLYTTFKIKNFRVKKISVLNKKGYSGKVIVNNKEVLLNDKCIKLLGELENRYGRVYMVLSKRYLAIQFFGSNVCNKYKVNPFLEKGVDTEDHLRIIELSNMEKDFSGIIEELLGEIQFLK